MRIDVISPILTLVKLVLLFSAGVQFGRLDVPDTAAGPMDYLLFCGLPLLGSLVAGGFRWLRKPMAGSAPTVSRPLAALGAESQDLIAAGNLDGAQRILDAARVAAGKSVKPAVMLLALWSCGCDFQLSYTSQPSNDPQKLTAPASASPRSPKWPEVRAKFLRDHPLCAACGGKDDLQVHHVLPFHLHPTLELDPANLITLCESPHRHCHFRVGHSWDWRAYNPQVREDAARELKRIRERKYE